MSTLGVVIPVGGHHGQYVVNALESLLTGTSRPDQVKIVLDRVGKPLPDLGPLDFPILETPPDRPGASAARNIGLAALTTDYVFYLDADDMVLPTAIQVMRDGMRWGYDMIHAREIKLSRGEKWTKQIPYDSIKELRRKVHAGKGEKPDFGVSVCVRRARALEIGGHDESMSFGEDNDFAIRYALPDEVTVYEYTGTLVHARSETSTRWTGVTVQDDTVYVERLRSGFYVQGLVRWGFQRESEQ